MNAIIVVEKIKQLIEKIKQLRLKALIKIAKIKQWYWRKRLELLKKKG